MIANPKKDKTARRIRPTYTLEEGKIIRWGDATHDDFEILRGEPSFEIVNPIPNQRMYDKGVLTLDALNYGQHIRMNRPDYLPRLAALRKRRRQMAKASRKRNR